MSELESSVILYVIMSTGDPVCNVLDKVNERITQD